MIICRPLVHLLLGPRGEQYWLSSLFGSIKNFAFLILCAGLAFRTTNSTGVSEAVALATLVDAVPWYTSWHPLHTSWCLRGCLFSSICVDSANGPGNSSLYLQSTAAQKSSTSVLSLVERKSEVCPFVVGWSAFCFKNQKHKQVGLDTVRKQPNRIRLLKL